MLTAVELRVEMLDGTAKHAPFQLDETSIEGHAAVHRREKAEGAFAPDIGRLDRGAVLQDRKQRKNRAFGKVSVFQMPARFADDRTELVFHLNQMGRNPRAAGGRQGAEQLIVLQNIFLTFGHNEIAELRGSVPSPARSIARQPM